MSYQHDVKAWAVTAMMAGALGGCVRGEALRVHTDYLDVNVERLHEPALRCDAEREIALAEAHLEFAKYEMRMGNVLPARRHVEISLDNLERVEAIVGDRPECFGIPIVLDTDQDGVLDDVDNCMLDPNPGQEDQDEDGIGDVCDDSDGDGIFDDTDNCVDRENNDQADLDGDGIGDVCDEDADGDGVMNRPDNCDWTPNPDQSDIDGDGVGDACSEDRDGDGIPDADDACPDDPEDPDGYEDFDGCPEDDNDLDGFLDPVDGCPDEAEDFDGDQDEDGCPDESSLVVVTDTMIQINDQINFELDSAVITGAISFQILDEVAQVLLERQEMEVRVEGHTDGQGSASYNLELSQNRADSVREYLISAGVTPSRLTAVGYGEERPIDDNSTPEGRAANRRVEFHITEQ